MPDNASQTNINKGSYRLYCFLFITNLFISSLLGLLVVQFLTIQTSIKDLPTFLENGNTLFVNTNSFIKRNEPLVQDVLRGVLLNSVQFNKTMLEINNIIDVTQPRILNLINFTENQLYKIDNLLNDNLKQLVIIDNSLKEMSSNNIATPSSSSVSNVDQTSSPSFYPTISNFSP